MLSASRLPVLLTPGAAFSWEFWYRGRWQLAQIVGAGLVVPALLSFTELVIKWQLYRQTGSWGEDSVPPPAAHMATLMVQLLCAIAVPVSLITTGNAHFVLPVPTRTLVCWRLFHGGILVVSGMFLATILSRWLLRVDWPIVPPAMYALLGWFSTVWIYHEYRGREWKMALAGTLVAGVMIFALQKHFLVWEDGRLLDRAFILMSLDEAGIVVLATLMFGIAAVSAGERDRCGLTGVGAVSLAGPGIAEAPAAPTHRLTGQVAPLRQFRTSWGAMFQFDFARSGWLFPLATAITMLFGCTLAFGTILYEWRRSGHLLDFPTFIVEMLGVGMGVFFVGPFIQTVASAQGREALSRNRSSFWRLSLPLTDRRIGMLAVLRQFASNILAMIACWVVGLLFFGLTVATLPVVGDSRDMLRLWDSLTPRQPQDIPGIAVCAALAGWVLTGVSEAAVQSGRRWVAGLPHALVIAFWLLVVMFAAINPASVEPMFVLLAFLGAVCSVVSVGMAIYSRVIPAWWGVAALGLWVAARVLVALFVELNPTGSQAWMATLLTAYVMLPLALPPLAVNWNRHR